MSVSQFHNKSNEDTQHPSFQLKEETVATDPESSESELPVESSGEAVASKGKALRKAAAKRAARRQSAAEKPKAGGWGKETGIISGRAIVFLLVFDSFCVFTFIFGEFTKSRAFC